MSASTNQTLPLAKVLWPAGEANAARSVVLVVIGSILLTVSAKTQVPFWPVPMTMQTFVVLILGAAYGWRLAGVTVAVYLAQGAAGLPVFAGGGGLAYLAGPTGGYLAGFLAGAMVVGWLAERGYDRRVATALLAFLAAEGVMFGLGLAWLSGLIGAEKAVMAGLYPFVPGEALKVGLAVALMPLVWRKVGRSG